jgi:hypothetical protein
MLIEAPRVRVGCNAFVSDANGLVNIDRGQDYGGVLVGLHELRIQRRSCVKERGQQLEIELGQAIDLNVFRKAKDLATNILQ